MESIRIAHSVAILLDGGFVRLKLRERLKKHPTASDVLNFALACLKQDEELFRVYYYDCPPYEDVVKNPLSGEVTDYSESTSTARSKEFQRQLSLMDHIAFRKGTLRCRGWIIAPNAARDIVKRGRPVTAADLIPDLKQKEVDMKIGLDVAWLASKKIVHKLILVAGDSDFVPAMKFARREGVQVILVSMEHKQIKADLKIHADEVRPVYYPGLASLPDPAPTDTPANE